MQADFPVVFDACVLANFQVCDLFLRLAETPRLYVPKWSAQILQETHATHVGKLDWPTKLADSFRDSLEAAFPDAAVKDYEQMIPILENDEKDRHVLAAAIRANVELIVTFNLRHFPAHALVKWGIRAIHPANYLITLYEIAPGIMVQKLEGMARKRGKTLEEVLISLSVSVPIFSHYMVDALRIFEIP